MKDLAVEVGLCEGSLNASKRDSRNLSGNRQASQLRLKLMMLMRVDPVDMLDKFEEAVEVDE